MKVIHLSSAALAAAILSTTAAYAQDVCGLAGGQWIGGDEASSDIATASAYQEQMALVLGGNEYVSLFSLSAPTDVRIEAAGRGAGDPLIDVYDADGAVILSDDDSGGNGSARGEATLDAGTYCMAMRSYDAAPMTAFVRIGRSEQEALTAGIENTPVTNETDPADATIGTGSGNCETAQQMDGSITDGFRISSPAGEEGGFWQFTLDAPTAVTITANNTSADPVLTLYDSNAVLLDENDDFDGLNSQIEYTDPLEAGTYCLGLAALDDTSIPIDLSVVTFDPAAALLALYASGDAAPPLDGSVPFTNLGVLKTRMRQDVATTNDVSWFSVDMDAPGLLLVESIGVGDDGDTVLVAYDDLGREVAYNDDYGSGYDSLLAMRVNAGTYIIGVRQLEDAGPAQVRLVFERYESAR